MIGEPEHGGHDGLIHAMAQQTAQLARVADAMLLLAAAIGELLGEEMGAPEDHQAPATPAHEYIDDDEGIGGPA